TKTAAQKAFQRLIQLHVPEQEYKYIQARPIVRGGDDLTDIIHGQYAIPFTHFYLKEFERTALRIREQPLTACASIALVKSGLPFAQAHALAENLCKSAKEILERKTGLLFHRVTTSDSDRRWDRIC